MDCSIRARRQTLQPQNVTLARGQLHRLVRPCRVHTAFECRHLPAGKAAQSGRAKQKRAHGGEREADDEQPPDDWSGANTGCYESADDATDCNSDATARRLLRRRPKSRLHEPRSLRREFLGRGFHLDQRAGLTRHKISCREPSVHATQHTLSTADTPSVNVRLARGQLHPLVRRCGHSHRTRDAGLVAGVAARRAGAFR